MTPKKSDKQRVSASRTPRRVAETPATCGQQTLGVETGVETPVEKCRCHSGPLYASLDRCPVCGHNSLDRVGDWEGCERRNCGYQKTETDPRTILGLRWCPDCRTHHHGGEA